jgi:hypothetical protein
VRAPKEGSGRQCPPSSAAERVNAPPLRTRSAELWQPESAELTRVQTTAARRRMRSVRRREISSCPAGAARAVAGARSDFRIRLEEAYPGSGKVGHRSPYPARAPKTSQQDTWTCCWVASTRSDASTAPSAKSRRCRTVVRRHGPPVRISGSNPLCDHEPAENVRLQRRDSNPFSVRIRDQPDRTVRNHSELQERARARKRDLPPEPPKVVLPGGAPPMPQRKSRLARPR